MPVAREEFDRFGLTYTLLKTDDGWKIAVVTAHDTDTVLQLS